MNDNYHLDKLNTRNYRSLGKYEKDNLNNFLLKEKFLKNGVNEKISIYINEKADKRKSKQTNRSLLKNAEYYTDVIDYNNGLFDGKHFHIEKKWIKQKGYNDFLEKRRRIGDIALKKIKFRNYGFGVVMFFFFFLVVVGIPLSPGLTFLNNIKWTEIKNNTVGNFFYDAIEKMTNITDTYSYIVYFSIIIVILSVMLIIRIYNILKNNEKYSKIKIINEHNN
ncbi:fam-m protein [Plasmodium brasilianum]|uniref:fam-m protein n=1 Tax=Plasmodium brasilianum TaxID=5824 RepID=UPI00350E49CC|nr:fam-m protein [Plasmodium brasilianum]